MFALIHKSSRVQTDRTGRQKEDATLDESTREALRNRMGSLLYHIIGFYILTADGGRGWVALVMLIGIAMASSFAVERWRYGNEWPDVAAIGFLSATFFTGFYVGTMNGDDEEATDVGWTEFLLGFCLAEAVFYGLVLFTNTWAGATIVWSLGVCALQCTIFVTLGAHVHPSSRTLRISF